MRERQREEEGDTDNPFRYNTVCRQREREKMMRGEMEGREERAKKLLLKYFLRH